MKKKQNKREKNKKGISLIVLIITIIVIIILAGAVLLSLVTNNPTEEAMEAKWKENVRSYQAELTLWLSKEYVKTNASFKAEEVNATQHEGSYEGNKLQDIITTMQEADKFAIKAGILVYIGEEDTEKEWAKEIGIGVGEVEEGNAVVEVGGIRFNKPDLSYLPEATTRAVMWDDSYGEKELTIKEAKNNTTWYDYAAKEWANIYTNNMDHKAYWVWIPRYAYKITTSHSVTASQIQITFLAGITDEAADGSSLEGYTVHPAFTFGDKPLKGIWVAKYEASSNAQSAANLGGGNTTSLQVRVLPNVYSWRNITTGNAQTVSMDMSSEVGSIGTSANVDTHQMKNTEWGVVAYLSQSSYGTEPWINPMGDAEQYRFKTGYAGNSKDCQPLSEGVSGLSPYNTINGVKASTTGTIYGVYDMSGGASEMTASLITNGNSSIGTYGKAEHIENNKIKAEYAKYYDMYEPGDEEKEGGTYYGAGGTTLWNADYTSNSIRQRITAATYAKMASKKGEAIYETSRSISFLAKWTLGGASFGTYGWFMNLADTSSNSTTAVGWNGDYILLGHASSCWFLRGAAYNNGSMAGLFALSATNGGVGKVSAFRPVLVQGSSL